MSCGTAGSYPLSVLALATLLCGACGVGEADIYASAGEQRGDTSGPLTGQGLQGQYFATTTLTQPVLTRLDPRVNFDWGMGSPGAGIAANDFSVRWTGFLTPAYSEIYVFTTTSDDGVRLTVDGKHLVDNWTHHAATNNSGTVTLTAGRPVPVTLEYFERGGRAVAKLWWASPSQKMEIVPSERLSPTLSPSPSADKNLLANGSFEIDTQGWGSWQGTVSRESNALSPDGRFVARVTATVAGMHSLDDAPDTVPAPSAGARFYASASVAAAGASAVGKTASLIIREKNPAGQTYQLWQQSVVLTSAFQKLSTSATVARDGDVVDLYVLLDGSTVGDAFLVDALWLGSAASSLSVDAGTSLPTGADAGVVDTGAGSPSGQPMPVGNLPNFQQVFTDDFTTDVPLGSFPAAVSSRWTAYPSPWPDTSRHGVYSPLKVLSQKNGVLNMYIHTENGVHLVAAPVPKIPGGPSGGGLLYGRYAVRFRADPLRGYKTAWLLWPDSETWPRDGEIDFPEGNLDRTIEAYMHRQGATTGGDQDAFSTSTTYSAWHTAVTEWTPTAVRFILDGVTIGTSTSRIPNTPMHWVLQTETALDGTVPADSVAGNVEIDWVAVWKYVP